MRISVSDATVSTASRHLDAGGISENDAAAGELLGSD